MPLTIIDAEERIPVPIGDATIYCRRMSEDVLKDIDRKYRVRRRDGQGRPYFEIDDSRAEERTAEIWDYIITDWVNVVHPVTGAPVPCDAAHKVKLSGDTYDRISEKLRQGAAPPDPTTASGRPSGGNSSSPTGPAPSA